ncbi:MAG: hypothetical protein RI573_19015 [Balneolaceae bacterium]|nr:hypothetical protein [Balneolaceae bacterium]
MASQEQFLKALAKPYDRLLFAKDVLKPVFGNSFKLEEQLRQTGEKPNKTEQKSIKSVGIYGKITLDDGRTVTCYEIELQPRVRIEQNRVTIQQYVRKLLPAGQSALINFVQSDDKTTWRFTLVAKQSVLTDEGIEAKSTNAERYTYLVEANQPNRTLASRLEKLGTEKSQNLKALIEAFSVEKLSKLFFDEYKVQYDKFVKHLTGKIWTKSGVKEEGERISQFVNYFKTETDREKEARDFVKKLLGRIVFLYFVQKKGWLGTKTPDFNKGNQDFIYDLFKQIPDHDDQKERFYCDWLRPLFFDTLNRDDDHAFTMPDGSTVFIPFLNGGLFEEDKTDQNTKQLLLPGTLFSNPEDTESRNTRGFLDFLSAFNFTIHEDSPDEHTVAVDPEMLGHIFENLLEDNKDKGAYYTPKPIVHYMCQESLIEYLLTELTAEGTEDSEKEELRGHLEDLIKKQEAGELVGFTEPILKSLKEVKVCDPAIGSGAFPMGILQEIYQAVETLHHLSPDNVQAIWELPDDDWHPAEVKKQIIQNSIYGVDIEKGAPWTLPGCASGSR